MKLTKTIQNLLEKIDISDLPPWETGSSPKQWAIIENQAIPEPKQCIFCGESVPLTWEINKEIMVNEPNFKSDCGNDDGMRPSVYRVAREIHPKCGKLRKLFNEWGVTEKRAFETESFVVDDENRNAYLMVDNWIKKPTSEGLYLFGPSGTGKTLLATKILLESAEQNKMIISESDLYDGLRPDINDENSTERISSFMKEIRRTGLLIIDDLGTSKSTPWKMETLFAVISKRIDWNLPTFFTSNYHPAELNDRIDRKIVSRVFELTNPCIVGGIDHRLIRKS